MEAVTFSSTETKRCGVCTGYLSGQPFMTSECAHTFHVGCYEHNNNKNQTCPVCNTLWTRNNSNTQPFSPNPNPNPFAFSPFPKPQPTSTNPPNPIPSLKPWFPSSHSVEPEPPRFSDDEALPLPAAASSSSVNSLQKVTIKAVPERPAIASSESVSPFTVLVGVKAPSLPKSTLSSQRAPVDLVAVLDVSGSMDESSKLDLVKQAMQFVIDNLGPNDRLSIVSFSDSAERMIPLTRMTENGRVDAKKAVSLLEATYGTNIVAGLKMGVRVLEERLHMNPVSSIIFLSDGNDTASSPFQTVLNFPATRGGPQYLHLLPTAIYPKGRKQEDACSASPQTFPVHSFGFGSDHDPVTMHAISDASGGTFSFVESYAMVQDAFASCIGGLLSVVTQELRLTVRSASHGVEITSLSTGRYTGEISNQGSQGVIDVGDLYADEEKEFLVNLTVPPRLDNGDASSLLNIGCCYKDVVLKEVVKLQSDLVEIRRPKEVSPEETVVNLEVDRQRTRVKAAESIAKAQKMAEEGDLAGARVQLAAGRSAVMFSAAAQAGDGMCKWLSNDMEETEKRFASPSMYGQAGRAFALSGMSSHGRQRATTRGEKVDFGGPSFGGSSWGSAAPGSSSLGFGYATPNMFDMVSKSQQQVNNNSAKNEQVGSGAPSFGAPLFSAPNTSFGAPGSSFSFGGCAAPGSSSSGFRFATPNILDMVSKSQQPVNNNSEKNEPFGAPSFGAPNTSFNFSSCAAPGSSSFSFGGCATPSFGAPNLFGVVSKSQQQVNNNSNNNSAMNLIDSGAPSFGAPNTSFNFSSCAAPGSSSFGFGHVTPNFFGVVSNSQQQVDNNSNKQEQQVFL